MENFRDFFREIREGFKEMGKPENRCKSLKEIKKIENSENPLVIFLGHLFVAAACLLFYVCGCIFVDSFGYSEESFKPMIGGFIFAGAVVFVGGLRALKKVGDLGAFYMVVILSSVGYLVYSLFFNAR